LRRQQYARLQILLHRGDIQRRRHDDDDEIGTRGLLDLQRARQSDVAVKMALVKLIEEERADALQSRVGQHLAQEHAFGHVTDPRSGRSNVVEPHLVPDLAAEFYSARLRNPRRKHARRQPARL
jgi:hypothetical protein